MNKIIFLILVSLPLTVFSQVTNFLDKPYIEVIGKSDTLVSPDEIYLNILISEKDSKDKKSLEELETRMVRTLGRLGINTDEDLSTSDFASNFRNRSFGRQDVLKSKEYILKVSSAKAATQVLIELEKIEISNVDVREVRHSEIDNIRMTLRSRAIMNAREIADAYAAPLNQTIGKALHISEMPPGFNTAEYAYKPQAFGYGVDQEAADFVLQDIDFEKIKIEIAVIAKFALQ